MLYRYFLIFLPQVSGLCLGARDGRTLELDTCHGDTSWQTWSLDTYDST